MKLSDIKGDRAIDVIADLIDPIANIAEDPEAAELFRKKHLPEGMTAKQFVLQRLKKGLPALLKGHKDDIIAILATIEWTSPEEYRTGLDMTKLVKDCAELLTDEAFLGLFTSARSGEGDGPSTSAPESTGGRKA